MEGRLHKWVSTRSKNGRSIGGCETCRDRELHRMISVNSWILNRSMVMDLERPMVLFVCRAAKWGNR